MSNEAVSYPETEQVTNAYVYETVDTLLAITETISDILETGIEQIALVILKLHFDNEERADEERLVQIRQGTAYLMNSLRPMVRKTDSVFLLCQATQSPAHRPPDGVCCSMYFVLPGANHEGGQIVQNRLWEALLWRVHNLPERDVSRPRSISIGHSAYSEHHTGIAEFIEEASNANLRFDCQPEKPLRKATIRQARQAQQYETDEELPALARKLGIPYLSLLPRKVPHGVQKIVNPRLAQELHCYPIGRERNMLTVAMLDPQDRLALDRLQQETGLHIFPVLTHPRALQTVLEQLI